MFSMGEEVSEEKAVEKIKEADLDGDGRVASFSLSSLVYDGGVESLMELERSLDNLSLLNSLFCTIHYFQCVLQVRRDEFVVLMMPAVMDFIRFIH